MVLLTRFISVSPESGHVAGGHVTREKMAATALQLTSLIAHVRAGTVPIAARRVAVSSAAATTTARASSSITMAAADGGSPRYIDIGANLLDDMFQGEYRGKKAHPPDLDDVLERAAAAGVERIIVTAGSLEESKAALELVRSRRTGCPVALYTTVGVHPTRCLEFLPEAARLELEGLMAAAADGGGGDDTAAALAAAEAAILERSDVVLARETHVQALRDVLRGAAADGLVVAVGECGLDYDRLHFCPAGVQRAGFEVSSAECAI